MRKLFCLLLAVGVVGCSLPNSALSGDEDIKPIEQPKEVVEQPPAPEPEAPEAPEMTLGEEPDPVSPQFSVDAGNTKKKKKDGRRRKSPDENLDYSELMGMAEPLELKRGVLPPALGTRGYRPNLVAASYGDRTPGYGVLVEYSWNRLSAGLFYSYRNLKDYDRFNLSQSFVGLYGLYRWLPFQISPYLLMGLEIGDKTPVGFGGMAGLGIEARIYNGWTALLGYTYHSTARKGFFGGAFGWSF